MLNDQMPKNLSIMQDSDKVHIDMKWASGVELIYPAIISIICLLCYPLFLIGLFSYDNKNSISFVIILSPLLAAITFVLIKYLSILLNTSRIIISHDEMYISHFPLSINSKKRIFKNSIKQLYVDNNYNLKAILFDKSSIALINCRGNAEQATLIEIVIEDFWQIKDTKVVPSIHSTTDTSEASVFIKPPRLIITEENSQSMFTLKWYCFRIRGKYLITSLIFSILILMGAYQAQLKQSNYVETGLLTLLGLGLLFYSIFNIFKNYKIVLRDDKVIIQTYPFIPRKLIINKTDIIGILVEKVNHIWFQKGSFSDYSLIINSNSKKVCINSIEDEAVALYLKETILQYSKN